MTTNAELIARAREYANARGSWLGSPVMEDLADALESSDARARVAERELAIRGEQLVRSENERQALADWAKEAGPVVSGVRRLQLAHSPRAHNDALTDLEVIPLPKDLP